MTNHKQNSSEFCLWRRRTWGRCSSSNLGPQSVSHYNLVSSFALTESPGKHAILSSLFRGDTRPRPKGLRHRRFGGKRSSNCSKSYTTRLVVVELANDMKRRDKADEAEAHNQHNRGTDLQTRCIVCVEAQHVVAASSESTTTSISR